MTKTKYNPYECLCGKEFKDAKALYEHRKAITAEVDRILNKEKSK